MNPWSVDSDILRRLAMWEYERMQEMGGFDYGRKQWHAAVLRYHERPTTFVRLMSELQERRGKE